MKNKLKENNNEINEVVTLTKKILKLFYIGMIVAIILFGTIILEKLKVWDFLFTFIKVLAPLFIGFIIAWLLNPIVKKLNEKKIPRIFGSLIVYAIFLIIIYIFLRIFIPTIYKQINDLIATLPAILDKFTKFADDIVNQISISGLDLTAFKDNLFTSAGDFIVKFTNSLPNSLISILGSLASGIGTIVISLVVGLYMLFDFDSITRHFLKLVPNKNKYEIEVLLTDIGKEVRKTRQWNITSSNHGLCL